MADRSFLRRESEQFKLGFAFAIPADLEVHRSGAGGPGRASVLVEMSRGRLAGDYSYTGVRADSRFN